MTKENTPTPAGARTQQIKNGEYLSPNKSVSIYKPDTHPIDRMIRVYCTQFGSHWNLQVRGPLGIGCNGMKEGKSSIIANAGLDLEAMICLRDALGEFITEAQAVAKGEQCHGCYEGCHGRTADLKEDPMGLMLCPACRAEDVPGYSVHKGDCPYEHGGACTCE